MIQYLIEYSRKEVDMGKREDYEAKTEKLIAPIIAANHVELFDVDYVKEGQDWYLRVYIDKEADHSMKYLIRRIIFLTSIFLK